MEEQLKALQTCIERGKASMASPYPPDMKGQPGAVELVTSLLEAGVPAEQVLNEALVAGMREVGLRFQRGEAFVPDMLISADAMKKAMAILKEELVKAAVEPKGIFVVGTVEGDMHDIGKNLVAMMVEGAGYKVVDLGVNVSPEKFLAAVKENPGAMVGLSALLTTTMGAMKATIDTLRAEVPEVKVIVGGAPVTDAFAQEISASGYSADPQGAIELLDSLRAA